MGRSQPPISPWGPSYRAWITLLPSAPVGPVRPRLPGWPRRPRPCASGYLLRAAPDLGPLCLLRPLDLAGPADQWHHRAGAPVSPCGPRASRPCLALVLRAPVIQRASRAGISLWAPGPVRTRALLACGRLWPVGPAVPGARALRALWTSVTLVRRLVNRCHLADLVDLVDGVTLRTLRPIRLVLDLGGFLEPSVSLRTLRPCLGQRSALPDLADLATALPGDLVPL